MYERIKELAKEKNLSINEIEKSLGFAKGSLCKIDKHKPSSEKVHELARFLGTTTEYLETGVKPSENITNGMLLADIATDSELMNAVTNLKKIDKADRELVIALINRLSK